MRTLFLQAPSFDGFDGGAGSRYQAKREIKSFWYPTWLAQPAALVENSKLIDAPPHKTTLEDVVAQAKDFDMVVAHTSVPSFKSDVKVIEAMKAANPNLKAGMIGAKVAVNAEGSLREGASIDFVARNEFDFTIKEVADDVPMHEIKGLSYRNKQGVIVHNEDREILHNMDSLPFVTPVYKRDLVMENYFIGYLRHPYISIYTGRGCKSRCTFCLWPQTVGGHNYRTRSVGHVIEEIKWAKAAFPQTKEFFFDDDTFTDDLPRAEAIAKELGKLGIVWSCNAKANVPRKSLEKLKDGGLRLLLVGYETGNQQILYNIKKGMRIEVAEQFTKDCHDLGIKIHGTFILGLPGETTDTIRETKEFAKRINPHTIQVSLAAPYPGTFLYNQAVQNGWLDADHAELIDEHGIQIAPLHYPHLSHNEIFTSLEGFYREFYFRPNKIGSIVKEMITQEGMMKRRLREGVEFFHFLRNGVSTLLDVKGLIVTADDFGAARQVNDAVLSAHQNGILTAASLMVSAPAAVDAVTRAKQTPSLRVGLHVVLTDGRPTLPAAQIPDLVDADGFFRNDMALTGAKMFFLPHVRRQLNAEIAAQFEAFHATGLPCDHVNAHKHFHLHPSIASAILKQAKKYGVRGARVPLEPQDVLARVEPRKTSGVAMLTTPFAKMLRARFARAGLRSPDQVFGLAWSGAMTGARVKGLIENLPEGLTELYLHPATDGAWPGAAPGYRYAEELAGLVAVEVVQAARNSAIRRGGFADF